MVVVAQLVRALVCGTRSRRFEPGLPPISKDLEAIQDLFLFTKTNGIVRKQKSQQLIAGFLHTNTNYAFNVIYLQISQAVHPFL